MPTAGQVAAQRYIYKIHSNRLRKNHWKLNLPLEEARKNDELIALADSQVLRWIDELNGMSDCDEQAAEIKREIKKIKREENSAENRKKIRRLYSQLDKVQFKPDYMCLIIDRNSDYRRAVKGFSINGIKYKRLLGTAGGLKNCTVVFCSEKLVDEIHRRIDNERNMEQPLVTAKLEAYQALACSASVPVSMPNGILVVPDCETTFSSDIVYLTDECDGEPLMEDRYDEDETVNASDGCGMMCPALAERWSEELGLDYTMSGCNTRMAYEKGMVFTFDFLEFAETVAHSYMVTDAWGNEVDIRDVEIVLTTSMLKLWDGYESCEEYLEKSINNGYTFCVTKTCPEELESERTTNYQFIQPYNLDEDDIEELIQPTMQEFTDVLGADWVRTILFLKGTGLREDRIDYLENDIAKAIMIEPALVNDSYIKNVVYQMIRKRIDEAKIGVLKIHGNYSIISGDPYALCQSMFGMEVTGLLKAGEIYSKYWSDCGATALACYRAPMSCANNIRLVHPAYGDEVSHWYRYMKACTIFNAWDMSSAAMNGMDYDGDLVMLTDNKVLVDKLVELPAVMCIQRKAEKRVATEADFVNTDISSFGNEIGQITNWVTSMYEFKSHFEPDSKECEVLEYRIRCGQLFQQNAIDKMKGIVANPMPASWHDRAAVNKMPDGEEKSLYRSIVVDRKPYFMRYIYPALMRQYTTYVKSVNRNANRNFGMDIEEMRALPYEELSEQQINFLHSYERRMPVGMGNCVMNRICTRFEGEFDGYLSKQNKQKNNNFSLEMLKSGKKYRKNTFYNIKKLYEDYNHQVRQYKIFSAYEKLDSDTIAAELQVINDTFRRACAKACPNEKELCDIILDICYAKNATRAFAWNMCSRTIIQNLLEKHDYYLSLPVLDDEGDITYCGNRYIVKTVRAYNPDLEVKE